MLKPAIEQACPLILRGLETSADGCSKLKEVTEYLIGCKASNLLDI